MQVMPVALNAYSGDWEGRFFGMRHHQNGGTDDGNGLI